MKKRNNYDEEKEWILTLLVSGIIWIFEFYIDIFKDLLDFKEKEKNK